MKITYTTKNGRISAEIEGESQRDLFENVNKFQDVFEELIAASVALTMLDLSSETWMTTFTTN